MVRINLDDIDAKILKEMFFLDGHPIGTTELAKKVYELSEKNRYEVKKADQIIRQKLNKLVRYGILEKIEGDKKDFYILNKKKTLIGILLDNQIVWVKMT